MIDYPGDDQMRAQVQWQKLVYLQAHRAAYLQEDLRRIVQETLAPGLRRSQAR